MKHKTGVIVGFMVAISLAIFILCYQALAYPVETPTFPMASTAISLLGDEYLIDAADAGISIGLNQNQHKDLTDVAAITSRIDVQASSLRFINRFSTSTPFHLSLQMNDDVIVESVYDVVHKRLDFVVPAYQGRIGSVVFTTPTSTIAYIEDILPDFRFRLSGSRPIDFGTGYREVGVSIRDLQRSELLILKPVSRNLLPASEASFESGLWVKTVSDCSKSASGDAIISMSLSGDASHGRSSLLLASENHFACTNKAFSVNFKPNHLYYLVFDYKNIEGGAIRYYYKIGRGKDGFQEAQTIRANDRAWKTFETVLTTNAFGTMPIDIYFYATSDGTKKVTNLYDDIRLLELSQVVASIKFVEYPSAIGSTPFMLPLGEHAISLDGRTPTDNLLDAGLASFENGPWTQVVGDCNMRAPGEAKTAMAIVQGGSHGAFSLELASSNHPACTSRRFPIELLPSGVYDLSLDYKNITGSSGRVYYKLQGKVSQQEYSKTLSAAKGVWSSTSLQILPDAAANGIDIYLYAPSSGESTKVAYDNVVLVERMPRNFSRARVLLERVIDSESLRLEFDPMTRWRTGIRVYRVNEPLVVTIPNEYDVGAKARVVSCSWQKNDQRNMKIETVRKKGLFGSGFVLFGGQVIPDKWHYITNKYNSSWYLDAQELCENSATDRHAANELDLVNIDLVIELPAQRWFYLGLLISGTTLAGCLGYLGYEGVKSIRRRLAARKKELV